MGFMKQLLIKANLEKRKAEKMLKSDKPNAYERKPKAQEYLDRIEELK
jgi:hypothetical protein